MSNSNNQHDVFSERDITEEQAEREALMRAEREMRKIETGFPEWWACYEDTLPDMAPRAEVVELLRTAPSEFAIGLIYGKFTMRLEISAITKRPWK